MLIHSMNGGHDQRDEAGPLENEFGNDADTGNVNGTVVGGRIELRSGGTPV